MTKINFTKPEGWDKCVDKNQYIIHWIYSNRDNLDLKSNGEYLEAYSDGELVAKAIKYNDKTECYKYIKIADEGKEICDIKIPLVANIGDIMWFCTPTCINGEYCLNINDIRQVVIDNISGSTDMGVILHGDCIDEYKGYGVYGCQGLFYKTREEALEFIQEANESDNTNMFYVTKDLNFDNINNTKRYSYILTSKYKINQMIKDNTERIVSIKFNIWPGEIKNSIQTYKLKNDNKENRLLPSNGRSIFLLYLPECVPSYPVHDILHDDILIIDNK